MGFSGVGARQERHKPIQREYKNLSNLLYADFASIVIDATLPTQKQTSSKLYSHTHAKNVMSFKPKELSTRRYKNQDVGRSVMTWV